MDLNVRMGIKALLHVERRLVRANCNASRIPDLMQYIDADMGKGLPFVHAPLSYDSQSRGGAARENASEPAVGPRDMLADC